MKVDKRLINLMKDSDAYYVICVTGDTHVTSINGKSNNPLEIVHKLTQAMLGSIGKVMETKECTNAQPLLVTIMEAIKRWPKLKE